MPIVFSFTAFVALIVVVYFVAFATDRPDVAACRIAMSEQFAAAITDPGFKGTRPDACEGVSDADLARIVEEIIGGR